MLQNLGDLADRTKDMDAPALIDCLDWERPAHYSHRDIDRLAPPPGGYEMRIESLLGAPTSPPGWNSRC